MVVQVCDLPVIPLERGTKHPILKGWQKLGTAELCVYGARDPSKSWAIRCDHIVVVDVDAKPENENKACIDMEEFKKTIFNAPTYVVRSRSGNPHAYFLYDKERMSHWKKRIGMYGFVDVCMGQSSLVVAAGSVVDGTTYAVHRDGEIAAMPDWLYERVDIEMRRSGIEERRKKDAIHQSRQLGTKLGTNQTSGHPPHKTLTEGHAELEALLARHGGYENPCVHANNYNGYDIVFGHPHVCPITGHQHAHIDGFLFKTASDAIMAGCYSDRCRGRYKCIHKPAAAFEQSPELARLIDAAADKNTHHAIAMVAANLYKDTIKYVGSEGWFIFAKENGLWRQDRHGDNMRTLLSTAVSDEFARRIMYNNEKQREAATDAEKDAYDERYKKLNVVMTKLGDGYHKDKLIKEAQAMMRDDDFMDRLDDGPLLGFDDGVFDFRTMAFRTGRPDDYVSLSVGYRFPDGVDPEIIRDVRQVFTDPFDSEEMADYLLKTLASSMDGKRSVAEFFVWTGVGSNGKSTIQEIVMATLGRYAQPLDISFWTRPKGGAGGALPELADKRACRYVFSNEPEACDKLQVAKLKEATGGERLTARKLYGDPITYRPKFGIFILANTLPELSKVDGGISRRIRVVPFVHQFKQYPLPGQRLAKPSVMENCRNNMEWRRALMSLLIEKYKEIASLTAIPLPTEVQRASADYLDDNNPIGRFLAEHFTVTHDEADCIKASELYNEYINVTRDKNMTITAFGTSVTHVNGVPKKKKKVNGVVAWYYMGLQPRTGL